jgi:acetyltransferase-like isoleucine patch superfamily enzyme
MLENFYIHADYIEKHGGAIGDYSYGAFTLVHWNEGAKLFIGKFCSFAASTELMLGGGHRTDWITTYPFNSLCTEGWPNAASITGHPTTKGDIVIGNDVWIGRKCTIMSGVSIGDGACVASCSVVTRNVPEYAIVGGNPARIIRKRFDDSTIQRLLVLRWWDWPIEKINQSMTVLLGGDVSELLDREAVSVKVETL